MKIDDEEEDLRTFLIASMLDVQERDR
jgi:hypothetical protein